jgi:DNA-binding response OmpR family regulator
VALSRERIAEHVWDRGYESRTNVIDVIVGRLRRKLEEGGEASPIHTVKGVGYALAPRTDGAP